MGAVDGCGCEAPGPFALVANGCSTSPRARGMSRGHLIHGRGNFFRQSKGQAKFLGP
jgi:hypothetical protein